MNRGAPEEQHKGMPASKSVSLKAQLKSLYLNRSSMRNKQGKHEFLDQFQEYDIVSLSVA